MAIESSFNHIDDLNVSYPLIGDVLSQADDHMRGIKKVMKTTFPGSAGLGFARPILATEDEIDIVDGDTVATSTTLVDADRLIVNDAGTMVQIALTDLKEYIFEANHPIGDLHFNVNSANPLTYLGYGTWVSFGAGKMLISADATYLPEVTGGSKDAIVVAHTHGVTDPGHAHGIPSSPYGAAGSVYNIDGTQNASKRDITGSSQTGVSVNSEGVSGVDANMPPFIGVYVWKRTA